MSSNVLLSISLLVLQVLLGSIGTLFWTMIRDLRGQISDRKQENRDLANKLSDLEQRLPIHYVLKDDYVRTMASVDHKLDQVIGMVGEVSEDLKKHVVFDRQGVNA